MSESCHIKRYDIVKGGKLSGMNPDINNFSKKLKKCVTSGLISILAPDT